MKQRDPEYREYVAKLIVDEGRVAREVAHELEIPASTIGKWVKNYRQKKLERPGNEKYLTPSEVDKLQKQHEKELLKLKEENEILKKAMHIFTKNQT